VDEVGDAVSGESRGIPGNRRLAPGAGLSAFLVKGPDARIPVLLRTLETMASTRILSSPRLLTNDKEAAEIQIAEEVPVAQLNVLNNTVSSTSFQSFVPAGTQMKITPLISGGGHVRLAISLSLDAFLGTSPAPNLPPAKTTRKLSTNVTIPDGSTIILGGFTARREIETEAKVPILGDIPILGLLFRNTVSATQKSHIYVFISPRILSDQDFGDLLEQSRVEEERARTEAGHDEYEEEK
jgi:type II secretory pathway component GspD/PulD (secretin)